MEESLEEERSVVFAQGSGNMRQRGGMWIGLRRRHHGFRFLSLVLHCELAAAGGGY